MRRLGKLAALGAVMSLVTVGTAGAADFSPTVSFDLSKTKVRGNPEVQIHLEQESGEEELAHVTLRIPRGFKLPTDRRIENGDRLGTADITINAGPSCAAGGPASAPAPFTDKSIVEQDRTDDQKSSGVKAVWVVDLKPVTSIPLEITGSTRKGWKLDGDIPANEFTCPPLTFDATIFSKSEGGVKLIKNPSKPGVAVFAADFTSQESDQAVTIKQRIRITR